jgi:tubulin polyglutamylase TTLL4
MNIDVDKLFNRIKDVVIKTCISAEPHIYNSMTRERNLCFELYGFDILIDENLRPWLLEVNVLPSLSSSSPLDKKIKTTLMADIFNLIGIVPYDRKKYLKEEEDKKSKHFFGLSKNISLYKTKNINSLKTADSFGELTEDDIELILYSEEENARRGNFERIFPISQNVDDYMRYFEAMRYNNLLLWKWLKSNYSLPTGIYNQSALQT